MVKTMIVTSSIAYEVLFYLNYCYLGMFAICGVFLGIIKACITNYPIEALWTEPCLFSLLCLVEVLRIYLGRRGNMLNKKAPVFFSILLTVPSVTGICYFLMYQTYILKLEYIWGVALLIFQALELVYGIMFLFTVCKKSSVIT